MARYCPSMEMLDRSLHNHLLLIYSLSIAYQTSYYQSGGLTACADATQQRNSRKELQNFQYLWSNPVSGRPSGS